MANIFRKIRTQLLNEGKLRRYLLYTCGEILLVVIGILLALQINNWNQNHNNKSAELKALKDLKAEFILNKVRIEGKQNLRKQLIEPTKAYFNAISEGQADYAMFQASHKLPFMFGMTNPSNGVIESLISSGEISLIENDSLKYMIADWKDQLGNLNENEVILWEAGLDYKNAFTPIILDPRVSWDDRTQEDHQSAVENLYNNTAYRNKLVQLYTSNQVTIHNCDLILEQLNRILQLIDIEIDRLS